MEPYYKDDFGKFYCGDSREIIKTLPDNSVNCVVTSPPYFGLRDYGTAKWEGGSNNCTHEYQKGGRKESSKKQKTNDGTQFSQYEHECKKCGAIRVDSQMGLEQTPNEYVNSMVELFRDIKRVLRDDGTVWLNIGDSYSGSGGAGSWSKDRNGQINNANRKVEGLKPKDLIGIPWMLAFALRNDGWYLRNDIIWAKPNPMPESVRDRLTKSHEHIFLLSKNKNYYFDNMAIAEPAVWTSKRIENSDRGYAKKEDGTGLHPQHHGNRMSGKVIGQTQDGHKGPFSANGKVRANLKKGIPVRNKRDVWFITLKAFKGAHFATFPKDLIEPCVLAGCPEGGIVLDPFFGAGTTGLVAENLNRNWIGIELNDDYCKMAIERIKNARIK